MTVDPEVILSIEEALREAVDQSRAELVQGRFENVNHLASAVAGWAEALSYLEEA